jgi:hypothetical protein
MPWDFAAELARWGPGRRDTPVSPNLARSYCARVARTHYENFTVASALLPRRLVPHFHAVYAYCRWADDLADEARSPELLGWWRSELLAMYAGQPRHPVMVALRGTVMRFAIPPGPFLSLLTAFEQDQWVTEYGSFADLLGYCRNSANPVGHLVLYLFGCFTPDRAALSDEVCTGLQLANFWQDVGRDLDIGRVYLPREDRPGAVRVPGRRPAGPAIHPGVRRADVVRGGTDAGVLRPRGGAAAAIAAGGADRRGPVRPRRPGGAGRYRGAGVRRVEAAAGGGEMAEARDGG